MDVIKQMDAFEDFLNEPPDYEDKRFVRDYRHEAYAKWTVLRLSITEALSPKVRRMTFAEFRNVLCILTSIDRWELEAVGIIDIPKGQGAFPGCMDKPNATWQLFRSDPYIWLLRADDDRAAKLWSIIEARSAGERSSS